MKSSSVVLLTDPVHAAGSDILAAAGCKIVVAPDNSMAAVREFISEADALIVRSKLPDDMLETATRLRGIVRHGVGLDFIPMARAAELAIPVANVPGGNSQSVAEYIFAAIFELTRGLRFADRITREHDWWKARATAGKAVEIGGKCLGVVGLGQVGRRVAEIAANGLGMTVVGTQRRLSAMPPFVRPMTITELFSVSDFIVLCCPLTAETEGMVNAELLGRMKRTAYLVNAARGQLIEDAALVAAVREARIAGVAMDVFSQQPLPKGHPFRDLPNVLLTPHMASLTVDSMERIGRISCEEIVRMLRGERPLNLANPEIWPRAQARWKRLDGGLVSSGSRS